MLLVGYFEGIDSERGLECRCADSLSLREFLQLAEREIVPDHSWLSRTRSRLPLELHEQAFGWALHRLSEHGLIKGEWVGVEASPLSRHRNRVGRQSSTSSTPIRTTISRGRSSLPKRR